MIENVWQAVIDDELIIANLGVANDDATFEEALEKLRDLILWHVEVATNPQVNGGYKLVYVGDKSTEVDYDLPSRC